MCATRWTRISRRQCAGTGPSPPRAATRTGGVDENEAPRRQRPGRRARGPLAHPAGQTALAEPRAKRLAERGGFEPPIPLRVCRISSAVQSTTLPPLRAPLVGPRSHSEHVWVPCPFPRPRAEAGSGRSARVDIEDDGPAGKSTAATRSTGSGARNRAPSRTPHAANLSRWSRRGEGNGRCPLAVALTDLHDFGVQDAAPPGAACSKPVGGHQRWSQNTLIRT
jgi:hypothetical protein